MLVKVASGLGGLLMCNAVAKLAVSTQTIDDDAVLPVTSVAQGVCRTQ